MNILYSKPLFELRLKAFGVSYFIKVNGKSVFLEFNDYGQIDTTIPLNLWMRSGSNTIKLEVLPEIPGKDINSNSSIFVELWVRQHEEEKTSFKIASIAFEGKNLDSGSPTVNSTPSGRFESTKQFTGSSEGDVSVLDISMSTVPEFEGAMVFEREIIIPSSLPNWSFFRSEDLPDYDAMPDDQYYAARDELFVEYETLQNAIVNRDVDLILTKANERSRETDLAFYQALGTTEAKLRTSLQQALRDDNLELARLSPEFLGLRREDNKKLVRLIREGESSAIGFNFKSFEGSQSYDFIFRRENGKWIVTR